MIAFAIMKKFSYIRITSLAPFECGLQPKANARMPFSLQFFLISLVFLIFDMELILIYPALDSTSIRPIISSTILLILIFLLTARFYIE